MRAPALVGIVVALHVGGLGLLVLMQGCGTTLDRQAKYESLKNVEPPPEPVFPSKRRASTENAVVKTSETHPVEVLPLAERGTVYILKKGQTLSHVAKHFGLSARSLAEYNQIQNADVVYAGQELKIPSYATKLGAGDLPAPSHTPPSTDSGSSALPPVASATGSHGEKYVVQSGDTISHIAKRFGVKSAEISQANALKSDRILVGQSLVIPVAGDSSVTEVALTTPDADRSSPSTAAANQAGKESTQPADAFIPEIEISPEAPHTDLEGADAAVDSAVSLPEDAIPASQEKPIVYNVLVGDTIDDIAKLFIVNKQELLDMNGLTGNEELKVDQEILIPQSIF